MLDYQDKNTSSISESERLARMQLAWSENVGPVTFKHLIARFGNAKKALDALPDLAKRGGGKRPIKLFPKASAEKQLAKIMAFGGEFLIYGEPDYPQLLSHIEDAPPVLAIKGHKHLLDKKCIAMVGARNASTIGKKMAFQLAHDLGQNGLIIVSGLARGVDSAAHMGSIVTGTIAVLGTGLDIHYPHENTKLQERIGLEGLLVSEHVCGTKPQAQHFPRRNRIISGLATGVLVVEAAMRSGSLITARMANEQGRDVYAIPGSPLDPRAKGTNNLIRQGALMVESADDILDSLNSLRALELSDPTLSLFSGLSETQDIDEDYFEKIINELNTTPTAFDDIIRATNIAPQIFLSVLLELELAGRIQRHFGNKVSLIC